MSTDHKGGGYRSGCRCTDCVEKHRVQGVNYYRSLKAELLELRAWRDSVVSTAPSGSTQ
jgi:hypothetical protein